MDEKNLTKIFVSGLDSINRVHGFGHGFGGGLDGGDRQSDNANVLQKDLRRVQELLGPAKVMLRRLEQGDLAEAPSGDAVGTETWVPLHGKGAEAAGGGLVEGEKMRF